MELSVQIEGAQGLTWPIWQRLVADVEALGFKGLYCCDHFANPAPPDYDSLEVMTAMTYAAGHSTRIELGTLVAPVSWRDPVMLARQAMAIDDLSGGRFVLGIGAGWNAREHAMFGYPLGETRERMDRLTEATDVITRLIRGDAPQTFAGTYYHLQDATLLPRPRRPTRVMIGGSGPKRTLPLVARYADIWNAGGTVEEMRARNATLDGLLGAAGRAPGDMKRTMMKAIICGRSDAEYEARLRGPRRNPANANLSTQELLDQARGRWIIGTPQEVAEQIKAFEAAGVQEIMAQFLVVDDFEGIRVLGEEVLPLLD